MTMEMSVAAASGATESAPALSAEDRAAVLEAVRDFAAAELAGSRRVLDVEDASMTIKITLTPGHGMNYHSHENRDEVWTVISGTGHAILDGVRRDVKPGDILTMPAGCRHTVFADSELKIIEVQLGPAISVEDKQKYPLPQA